MQPSVYFLSKLANRTLLMLMLAISLLHLSTSLFLCHHSHPFLLAQDFLILPLDYSLFSTQPLSGAGQVHFLCLPIIYAGCEGAYLLQLHSASWFVARDTKEMLHSEGHTGIKSKVLDLWLGLYPSP